MKERSSKSLLANVLDMNDDFRPPDGFIRVQGPALQSHEEGGSLHHAPIHSHNVHHSCLGSQRELSLILKEIRCITDKIKKDDEDSEYTNDWQYAAMVVDRICLIIFSLFTILATIVCFLKAPHILV